MAEYIAPVIYKSPFGWAPPGFCQSDKTSRHPSGPAFCLQDHGAVNISKNVFFHFLLGQSGNHSAVGDVYDKGTGGIKG
jgi:hypothetical protein